MLDTQKAAKLITNPDATDSYLSAVEEFQQVITMQLEYTAY